MVDIFQFSNVYALTPHIVELLTNFDAQKELVDFVQLPDKPAPSFCRLFAFLSALKFGQTLQEWIQDNEIQRCHLDIR